MVIEQNGGGAPCAPHFGKTERRALELSCRVMSLRSSQQGAHVGLRTGLFLRVHTPLGRPGLTEICPPLWRLLAQCFILESDTCDVSGPRSVLPGRCTLHLGCTSWTASGTDPEQGPRWLLRGGRQPGFDSRQPAAVARGGPSQGSGRRRSIQKGSGRVPSEGRLQESARDETQHAVGQVPISAVVHKNDRTVSLHTLIRVGYYPASISPDVLTARQQWVMVRSWQVRVCCRLIVN